MQIKVCGMTQIAQVNALNDLNVDFVGFIFYEKSPRYVLNHLAENDIKNIGGSFKKAGVFVNADKDFIFKTIENCGLDLVQLHGDESPELCKTVSAGTTVVKAFGINNIFDSERNINEYSGSVDYFMFDTASKNYGGTGKKFDWDQLRKLRVQKPYFLSGGIDENDVTDIHSLTKTDAGKHLFSLDINSRFETAPGVKDIDKIGRFLKQLKAMEA